MELGETRWEAIWPLSDVSREMIRKADVWEPSNLNTRTRVSSSVTGVTCHGNIVSGLRLAFGPVSSPGALANRLEEIANGLGVPENGLGPIVRRTGTEVKSFGTGRREEENRGWEVWEWP